MQPVHLEKWLKLAHGMLVRLTFAVQVSSEPELSFAERVLISHDLIPGFISKHRPDYSRVFVSDRHGRFY